MLRESLSLLPTTDPRRSFSLGSLGGLFREHFATTSSMFELEEAILLHRESLSLRPTSHPSRFILLNNLANALFKRF